MSVVTKRQAETALKAAAKWLGPKMGCIKPCGKCTICKGGGREYDWQCERPIPVPAPTGPDAAYRGEGPELRMDWDWPGQPTPTLLLEGGPYDWAIELPNDPEFDATLRAAGIWAEPYAGYALCLYRED